MIEEKDSKNTERATKGGVKVFNEYLEEKNLDEPHHDDKVILANDLTRFYAEARKKVMGACFRKVPRLLYDLDSAGILTQKELTLYKTQNSPRGIRYF